MNCIPSNLSVFLYLFSLLFFFLLYFVNIYKLILDRYRPIVALDVQGFVRDLAGSRVLTLSHESMVKKFEKLSALQSYVCNIPSFSTPTVLLAPLLLR